MKDEDKRKRRGDPFGFGDFDREFISMRRYMDKVLESMMDGELEDDLNPMVYGFTMRVGPDGVPHVRRFGNTHYDVLAERRREAEPGEGRERLLMSSREPLVDVIDTDGSIAMTVEVPGVEKDDIDLEISGDEFTVRVYSGKHKYKKSIELPEPVKSDSAKATYNNGVLDIRLEKAERKRDGKKIEID